MASNDDSGAAEVRGVTRAGLVAGLTLKRNGSVGILAAVGTLAFLVSACEASHENRPLDTSPYASAFVSCRDIGGLFLAPGIKDVSSTYMLINSNAKTGTFYIEQSVVSMSEVRCREKLGDDYASFTSGLKVLEFRSRQDAAAYMSGLRNLITNSKHVLSAGRSWKPPTATDEVIQMESYPQSDLDKGVGFSMAVQVGRLVVEVARARPPSQPYISPEGLQWVHDMIWRDMESRMTQMLRELVHIR